MLGRKFRMGVVVAALALGSGLGTGAAAAGTAAAAPASVPMINQAALVLSDTISFSGVATPTGGGGFVLNSNNCTLTSDGENIVFPCTINLTFNLATLTGMGHTTSPDGVTNWSFKLVPGAVAGTFAVMGTCAAGANICYEIDSGNGEPAVMYPIADVTGTITVKPIPGTPNLQVTGRVNVWETPNMP